MIHSEFGPLTLEFLVVSHKVSLPPEGQGLLPKRSTEKVLSPAALYPLLAPVQPCSHNPEKLCPTQLSPQKNGEFAQMAVDVPFTFSAFH